MKALVATLCLTGIAFTVPASAQTFPSGSTGTDGDLKCLTPGIYVFDPSVVRHPD